MLVLAGLIGALACGRPDPAEANAMTRSQFIDVVVALRDARLDLESQPELADSVLEARYGEERDRILERHGITAGDLYAFVALHPELGYQTEVWDSITHRLKRPLATPEPDDVEVDSQAGPPDLPSPRPGALPRLGPDKK
ncbi:MAG: hypothetical protein R3314_06515 [Longimicrobiales bacterium]|nr:hypothetical protein [Longimicrobiales bacterium]